MGSCISKYRPNKKHSDPTVCPVQDKLIISSQVHPTPPTININPIPKKNVEPTIYSPSPSSSSSATVFPTTSSSFTSSSSSSLSSASSSISVSKERSFSNDFLRSCIKENPHVIRVVGDPDKKVTIINEENCVRKFVRPTSLSSSVVVSSKQSALSKPADQSTPQKRTSSGLLGVTRQKSFRRESTDHQMTNHNITSSSRTFLIRKNSLSAGHYSSNSSPSRSRINGDSGKGILRNSSSGDQYSSYSSPSRCKSNGDWAIGISSNSSSADHYSSYSPPIWSRINGDSAKGISRNSSPNKFNMEHHREFGFSKSKSNVPIHDYYNSPSRRNKENVRPASPFNRSRNGYGSSRKRETCTSTHHVRPDNKVYQNSSPSSAAAVLGEVVYSDKDLNSLQIDDFDNPLINLDCFIFLL